MVDDTIIFELSEGNYLVVVNAGMGSTVAQHLTAHIGSGDVETGQTLFLQDDRRTIRVRVVKDVRPDRTARRPINEML